MSDLDPRDNQLRAEVERLTRDAAQARPDKVLDVVNAWADDLSKPGVPEDVAHMALAFRDIAHVLGSALSPPKRILVVLIHGIRDQAEWFESVAAKLQTATVSVQPIDFEDFNSAHFMLGVGVNGVLRRVLARVRDAKTNFGTGDLYIIAHSFGTHLVSRILREEPDIRPTRVIFCGSVVPKSYRFDLVPYRPEFINECGARDIWPVIAQAFSCRYAYGTGGVWGFRTSGVTDRFHDIGHSGYLSAEFAEQFWRPYIHEQRIVQSEYQTKRRVVPRGVVMLSYGWRLLIPLVLASASAIVGLWWTLGRTAGLTAIGLILFAWILVFAWVAMAVCSYCSPRTAKLPAGQ